MDETHSDVFSWVKDEDGGITVEEMMVILSSLPPWMELRYHERSGETLPARRAEIEDGYALIS